jgi:TolB protein
MKKIVVLLVGIICLLTLSQCGKFDNLGNGTSQTGTWDYSKIAFMAQLAENNGAWSVCIMDKDGSNLHKVVDKAFGFPIPTRSHSGKQLLFTMDGLYFVGTDGSGLTLIEGANGNAAWSPDDKQIVYVKFSGNSRETSELFIYDIADKTHTVLPAIGNDKAWVCFSPNGKITYSAYEENSINIYMIDVDGENNQLLIPNGYCPIWSPKGDKIAYLSFGIDRSSQISVANADGNDQQQLTSSVSSRWWDTGFPRDGNEDPQWTMDGEKIVYVSWENDKPEIFIMDVNGSNQTRLTIAEYRDENPEITPDGQHILFSSRRSDMMNNGIVIMSLDGSNQRVLSTTGICPVACK